MTTRRKSVQKARLFTVVNCYCVSPGQFSNQMDDKSLDASAYFVFVGETNVDDTEVSLSIQSAAALKSRSLVLVIKSLNELKRV